jgi:hypothetical protein
MTKRNVDRVEEFKQDTNLEREAKKALLQELGRAAGREVNEQEGQEISRDLGGGPSLSQPRRGRVNLGARIRDSPAQTGADEQLILLKDSAGILCGAHRRRPPRPMLWPITRLPQAPQRTTQQQHGES